ncbi:MAG: hypothetical protein H6822_11265 [Planctomycetaceae bacterium]|nr:hypothetical protein [Planctomycetales bacterium]MCB9922753.1 hypothetical protein [Planctomycetaceae bacterium]
MILTIIAFALSSGLYASYAASAPNGPSGGSWQGMAFGFVGTMLMVFAGLLAGRKKLPRLPIGTARFWLRAHIWLGLLSVPMILFHAGFRWGGVLEQLLLIVFAVVTVSGIAGVVFQQYLPRVMKDATGREAMFEQLPSVCGALRTTADEQVVAVCGSLFPPVDDSRQEHESLRQFYVEIVRPFLSSTIEKQSPLLNVSRATAVFAQMQRVVPASSRVALTRLSSICDERRELVRLASLHKWLHYWLFFHVPLSMSLLVLAVAHIIASVYY